jgi:DNA polymerase-3 subunit epsilon
VIHNAAFDVGFLNNELGMLGKPVLTAICPSVIDTLKLAKEQNPGKKASLNALCSFYDIDNTHRTLHGALLDAELLADVYLAMTRGQESLIMALDEPAPQLDDTDGGTTLTERPRCACCGPAPRKSKATTRCSARSPRPTRGIACGCRRSQPRQPERSSGTRTQAAESCLRYRRCAADCMQYRNRP